jgi:regulatory protein
LEALIDHVLTHLAQNNWQSDARFAAQIGKVKGERYGAARIKHTLNQQGLSKELIDETVAELAQSELQRAHAVWQKKFGVAPSNASEYAKQSRFLAYRGFSFDVIKKVIQGKDLEWDE